MFLCRIAVSLAVTLYLATASLGIHAQEVVPGPWGDLIDPIATVKLTKDEERITLFRRMQMNALSAHFRSIEAVVIHGAPFTGHIRGDAAALETLANGLAVIFPPGTAAEKGKRGAQPEIWEESDKFARHITGLRETTARLSAALASGEDATAAFVGVRHQCLACHQSYRVRSGAN